MFGQNYKIINQSIEMFDDFNEFLTRNAPNSFMAANIQGAHSNKQFQRKSSRFSCKNPSSGEIDWEIEIEKEREKFRDDHYSYIPSNNTNSNYFTNRTLRPRNKNYYDSS